MALRNEDGDVLLDGDVTAKLGGSSETMGMKGIIAVSTTAVSNTASASDTNLFTVSVLGNTLNTNGDYLWFEVLLSTIANAGNLRLRIYFGATAFFDYTYVPTAQPIVIRGKIIRTGAATQRAYGTYMTTVAGGYTITKYGTPAQTLSSANNFIVAGQHLTANIVTLQSVILGFGRAS